jgi:hypothetical protein
MVVMKRASPLLAHLENSELYRPTPRPHSKRDADQIAYGPAVMVQVRRDFAGTGAATAARSLVRIA